MSILGFEDCARQITVSDTEDVLVVDVPGPTEYFCISNGRTPLLLVVQMPCSWMQRQENKDQPIELNYWSSLVVYKRMMFAWSIYQFQDPAYRNQQLGESHGFGVFSSFLAFVLIGNAAVHHCDQGSSHWVDNLSSDQKIVDVF